MYDRFHLMELCMELLGHYSLARDVEDGLVDREKPLTDFERIGALMALLDGEPGLPRLRQVLPYTEQRSRSPMETRQYLLLRLPKRYGGYGLTGARVNLRLPLSPHEQRVAKRTVLECDLIWPEHDVVIEYDGEGGHASFGARSRDATKRNVLMSRGMRVLTVTAEQILDVNAFDAVAHEVAEMTRHRLRRFPDDWDQRRKRLRDALFASMR